MQAAATKPPAVQLFDILPIKGSLRPGESEVVNFSFFAFPGVKASAVAMCQVEGGPTYNVSGTAGRVWGAWVQFLGVWEELPCAGSVAGPFAM